MANTQPVSPSSTPGPLRGFDPSIRQRLEALIAASPGGRRVAVFDADGTLWKDDSGEVFFRRLVADQRLLAVDYSRDLWVDYEALRARDKAAAYASLGPVMQGLREVDVVKWARSTFEQEIAHGIYGDMLLLLQQLAHAGFEVWIISASVQWIVEVGAARFAVPADRVVGMNVQVRDGLLTNLLVPPITYGPGKADAIDRFIGVAPELVAGDSQGDVPMLERAQRLALAINPAADGGPQSIACIARERGWAVQTWDL